MEGENKQQRKVLERKFILWTIQNDLDVALGRKTQPSEISIVVDDKASRTNLSAQTTQSDNITAQKKVLTPKVSNTATYLLILLIVFITGGILVYQFVGSRRIDVGIDIPKVGNIDLDKDNDGKKIEVPVVFPYATSSDKDFDVLATSSDLLVSTTTKASTSIVSTTTVSISTTTTTTTTAAVVGTTTEAIVSTSTIGFFKQARSLIPADLVETIEITALNQIWEKIEVYSQKIYDENIRLIRLTFILNDDFGPREPTLEEFIGGFGFVIPRNILAKSNQNVYNFFLFKQDEHFQEIDLKMRSVLLIEIKENEGLRELTREWESFILSDLAPRFFLKITPKKSRSDSFQDSEYTSKESTMTFRFMNYPEPDVSIDYMIDVKRGILLLAGSRQAAWYVADKLIKTNNYR